MNKAIKRSLLALSSIPLIMTLGNSMLIPVLPAMAQALGVKAFQISLIITVYSVVAIFLIPVAGFLSDHYGRTTIIIPALIITGIGGLISAAAATWLAEPYIWILVGRFVQGIGAAGAAPIVFPLVGEMFKKEEEISAALGIIETSNTFGKVISPILGSLLALIVWYFPFWAIPVLCIASLLLIKLLVKEPNKKNKQASFNAHKYFQEIKQVFHKKGRWIYAIFAIGGICMFVVFGALFYLSQFSEDTYQIHGVWKGFLLALPTSALCIASFVTGKLIGKNKMRMKWFNSIGIMLIPITMIVLALTGGKSIALDTALISVGLAGVGVSLPCLDAFIIEGIDKEIRGTTTSFYSSMRFIGVAAGPPIASIFINSPATFHYITAGLGVLSVIISICFIRINKFDTKSSTT